MAAVGRERQSPRKMARKLNAADFLSGGEVAETHAAMLMTAEERAPVRADGQVPVVVRAEVQPADLPAAVHVPDHQTRLGAPGVARDLSPDRQEEGPNLQALITTRLRILEGWQHAQRLAGGY